MQHKRFLKCRLVMMAVSAMPCLAVTPAALAGRVDARIYPVRDRSECASLNGTWDLQIDEGPWVKAIVPRVEIDDGRTVAPVRPAVLRNIYSAVIEAHAANVRAAGAKDQASADEAIRNLRLCAAAHRSARQGGAWIAIR